MGDFASRPIGTNVQTDGGSLVIMHCILYWSGPPSRKMHLDDLRLAARPFESQISNKGGY